MKSSIHFLNKGNPNAICKLAVAFLLLSIENFTSVDTCFHFFSSKYTLPHCLLFRYHVHFQFPQKRSSILLQKIAQDQVGFVPEPTSASCMTSENHRKAFSDSDLTSGLH